MPLAADGKLWGEKGCDRGGRIEGRPSDSAFALIEGHADLAQSGCTTRLRKEAKKTPLPAAASEAFR